MELMVKLNIHPSFLPSLIARSVNELDLLCFTHHGKPTDKQHADGRDRFCSSGDLKYYILATENDRLIGETRVYKRTILFNGQKIILGGIGSVATHPDFRKQGIATKMVKKGMDFLKKDQCDAVYLCADAHSLKALEFYEQFGFRRLLQNHTYTARSGKRYTDADGMIAPVNSKKLFRQILASSTPFDIGVGNW
jgi:ribosomal protein S18 acetylase RimI-like enzyme